MINPSKKVKEDFPKKSSDYSSKNTSSLAKKFSTKSFKNSPSKFSKDKKDKKSNQYWDQRFLKPEDIRKELEKEQKKLKRQRLKSVIFLKKFNYLIDATNLAIFVPFITKFGKIKPRKKTKIPAHLHRKMVKAIKKARAFGLIPHSCNVSIKVQARYEKSKK